ncbi:alcohol dehydrogenase-like protein [Pontibacter ummariensis]|uniref:Alcohol dehydrogenase GroES-like domain-containing protein n=1 Tax=Pontibacter ummariensis TaxID=1610492 RepID=A0A239KSW8_9BACT|nr:alcohol dehydrogenase catalytic domain-containing protein [Pontibacter ummariensis]PRY05013.1 alcohol dehydrogenase-like protein [Pontibacter ummariensis]SNT21120.1 Alcohol dehydrogenase GroES-like domain-containing protein [Pontibacter ummariensis]
MKSLHFKAFGAPQAVLEFGDSHKPTPQENEVLVKVAASPVSPADYIFIHGRYRVQPVLPQIAGLEGAGVVVQADKAGKVPVGSLVSFRHRGCWAEFVSVPVEKLYILPKAFPLEKACQFALNQITAWALLEQAKVQENSWLLLTAGNSTVSRVIIQLARKRGIHVIAATRGKKDETDH